MIAVDLDYHKEDSLCLHSKDRGGKKSGPDAGS